MRALLRMTPWMTWLALIALAGCSASGAGLLRVDGDSTIETRPPRRMGAPRVTIVDLARPARILKITVIPRQPLRKFRVEVRSAPGVWNLVRAFDGRYTTPITVRTDLIGDAVRVVEEGPTLRRQSGLYIAGGAGPIETVLVYGFPLDGSEP